MMYKLPAPFSTNGSFGFIDNLTTLKPITNGAESRRLSGVTLLQGKMTFQLLPESNENCEHKVKI